MSAKRIVLVVGRIFQGLHAKNRQTLAVLMAALLVTGRAGVASLGRGIQSRTAFKHSIKRVDRFLGNDNVVVCDWCKALFATVLGPRKSVKIAIDWTKIGPWPVLVASVVIRRRGIPIYWATCDFRKLQRSQNAFENRRIGTFIHKTPPWRIGTFIHKTPPWDEYGRGSSGCQSVKVGNRHERGERGGCYASCWHGRDGSVDGSRSGSLGGRRPTCAEEEEGQERVTSGGSRAGAGPGREALSPGRRRRSARRPNVTYPDVGSRTPWSSSAHRSSVFRAGAIVGTVEGRCRWSRMRVTTAGSVRKASTTMGVAHLGQERASTCRARCNRRAHDRCVRFRNSPGFGVTGAFGIWRSPGVLSSPRAFLSLAGGCGRALRYLERFAKTPW